jgi:prenyl protein peptidase
MAEFIWRLPPDGPALLTRPETVLVCGVLTSTYVGSLYILKTTRVARRGPLARNHPKVIKARLWSVGLSSLTSVAGVWAIARWKGLFRTDVRDTSVSFLWGEDIITDTCYFSFLLPFIGESRNENTCAQHTQSIPKQLLGVCKLLGLCLPNSISETISLVVFPLTLTATLFIGPLYTAWLDESLPGQRDFDWHRDVVDRFTDLRGVRNYIVVRQILSQPQTRMLPPCLADWSDLSYNFFFQRAR